MVFRSGGSGKDGRDGSGPESHRGGDDVHPQKKSGAVEMLLPVGEMAVVWPTAQRPFSQSHGDAIAADFDWDLLGHVIVAGPLKNGKYHIVEGQHRVYAVHKNYGPNETIFCDVYADLDKAGAAAKFRRFNGHRKAMKRLDMFRTGVTEGSQPEVTIEKVVGSTGFSIGYGQHGIKAVGALETVFRMGGDHGKKLLHETLIAIRETWGLDDPAAADSVVIKSFALFLKVHWDANRERLYKRMAKEFVPVSFLGSVKSIASAGRTTSTETGKTIMVRIYNQGLKTGRLEER